MVIVRKTRHRQLDTWMAWSVSNRLMKLNHMRSLFLPSVVSRHCTNCACFGQTPARRSHLLQSHPDLRRVLNCTRSRCHGNCVLRLHCGAGASARGLQKQQQQQQAARRPATAAWFLRSSHCRKQNYECQPKPRSVSECAGQQKLQRRQRRRSRRRGGRERRSRSFRAQCRRRCGQCALP
jgi:hypothetical protein